jgi:ribosomal protein L6P/L9E
MFFLMYFTINRIGDVKDSVLASSAVNRVFEPRSGQTKAMKLICVASLVNNIVYAVTLDYKYLLGFLPNKNCYSKIVSE